MKKRSAASPASNPRQEKFRSLKDSIAKVATSPAPAPAEIRRPCATLSSAHCQEIENAFENYCYSWGEKSHKSSDLSKGGASRQDIDLDSRGLQLLSAFRSAAQVAAAQGVAVPPQFLEALVLVLRNDVVHKSSHVSRGAFAALMAYFKSKPYATLSHYPSSAGGKPYVSINPTVAWLPIEDDRTSFTSKYLLGDDMSEAGKLHRSNRIAADNHKSSKRIKLEKWGSPAEFLLYFTEKALKSAEDDKNGDLQLMEYVLSVVEQDATARVTVHKEMIGDEKLAGRRHALLENSLIWRIFAGQLVSKDLQRDIIRGLVALISGSQVDDIDDVLAVAEEEPEDDAPAGACVYTRQELAALAARILRVLLLVFGTAEANGAFLATGKHRSSNTNLRIMLDSILIETVWSEKGVCKDPEASRALLQALPPKDCLRLLGILAARKFTRTYDATSLGSYAKLVGDIAPYMNEVNGMLGRGSDIDAFFQVNMCPVIASLHREPARACKTFKSLDHVAVILGAIACAVQSLIATGEDIPTGEGGRESLKKELEAAALAMTSAVHGASGEGMTLSLNGFSDISLVTLTTRIL